MVNAEVVEWLIEGPPWVRYRTRIDLLDESPDSSMAGKDYEAMINHPAIKELIDELSQWPGQVLKNHRSAGHLIHKLTFAADIGLQADTPGMRKVADRIFRHRSHEGLFQILVNINPKYGGTGNDQFSWMLCDAPLVIYALAMFGFGKDKRIFPAVEYLTGLIRENGWPCAADPELGKFRGPGRKADPCPFASLVMLKTLSLAAAVNGGDEFMQPVKTGVETLLNLWEKRKERRPYLFAMGTDFAKLKAPFVWYDILHVVEVLTGIVPKFPVRFLWLKKDFRLQEMIEKIKSKACARESGSSRNSDGTGKGAGNLYFTPESVWRDWKEWDFGQKKIPSRWLTLLVYRMLKRVE